MLTEDQLREYKQYFEGQYFPPCFAGGKIKAKGVDVYGQMSPDGKCRKIFEITDEYEFQYNPPT